MSWSGSLRKMVLEDQVEAARLKGAKSPHREDDEPLVPDRAEPRRRDLSGPRRDGAQ